MSFLAPLMLAGAAAVSVPLILHFFYKARHRPLPWAAMKFLKQSIEQTSRRLKFQEWILLALRCLALILLAIAIARPSFTASAGSGRSEGVDAIFVFDTSFSMGAQDGEETRLQRAKTAARTIIDNLPPNSTVQVFTSAGTDRVNKVVFTSTNLDQARNVVDAVSLTSLSGDVLPGLNAANTALDDPTNISGASKEVYLFTDLQKSGWDRQAGALRGKAAEIKQRATLIIVRCGNPERAVNNAVILDITMPESIPVAETRVPVTVLVKNTGKSELKNIPVTLEVDGLTQDVDTGLAVEIKPGQIAPVTITAKMGKAGSRLLTAKLGGRAKDGEGQDTNRVVVDDLPGDNRFDKIIQVRERIRVLIVDGNPNPRDSKESGGHYIRNALQPVPESQRSSYFVRVNEVLANEASASTLGDTDICILVNVPSSPEDRPGIPGLSKEFANRLPRFVQEGGSLIIAAGDFIVPARYNAIFGSIGNKLLPFDLTEASTAPKEAPFRPAPDTTLVPSFISKFREVPYSTITSQVDVFTTMGVNEAVGGGTVLMRLNSGKPLMTMKGIGEGEVLFFNTTLDAKWTNWPALAGSYVSMFRQALSHLTGRATRSGNRTAGEPLVYTPTDAKRPFELEKPDKTRVQLGQARGGTDGEALNVTTSDTLVAGEYVIGPEGDTPLRGGRYAVVPDLQESENLESLNDTQTEDYISFKPVMVLAGNEAESQIGAERSKREWTIWVLIALLFVASAEAGWAWFCGKAW